MRVLRRVWRLCVGMGGGGWLRGPLPLGFFFPRGAARARGRRLAERGGELAGREVVDFFGSHGNDSPVNQTTAPSRTMKRQRKGSLASARRKASLAMVAGTPASSKSTAPGLMTAT